MYISEAGNLSFGQIEEVKQLLAILADFMARKVMLLIYNMFNSLLKTMRRETLRDKNLP